MKNVKQGTRADYGQHNPTKQTMKTNTQETNYSIRRCDTGDYLRHFSNDKLTFTDNEWEKQCYTRERAEAIKQALETLYASVSLTFNVNLDN